MKKITSFTFILLSIFLMSFSKEGEMLEVSNVTTKQKFEVWISEGNEHIFNGIVYPGRSIFVKMIPGKLYGIFSKRLTKETEYVSQIKGNIDPLPEINEISYYVCKENTSLYFQLICQDQS